jgi:hypothetical protein
MGENRRVDIQKAYVSLLHSTGTDAYTVLDEEPPPADPPPGM